MLAVRELKVQEGRTIGTHDAAARPTMMFASHQRERRATETARGREMVRLPRHVKEFLTAFVTRSATPSPTPVGWAGGGYVGCNAGPRTCSITCVGPRDEAACGAWALRIGTAMWSHW